LIAVDASIVAEYLLNGAVRPDLKDLFSGQDTLAAPSLIDFEIGSVLRRHYLNGAVTEIRARQCLELLGSLRIDLHEASPYAGEIWRLRDNYTYYDASYIALAEALRIPLYTLDRKFVGAVHNAQIVVV
jgi:predicted nucleic acid-binding protein